MEIKQSANIHNRFDVEVKNIETGKIKKYVAHNIVLDQMWTRLCGGSNYYVNIHFGTGSGTPSASRTSLFSHLGTKTAVDEELIKAIPLSTWKRKIVLNPEEYVGSTITEVGIAFGGTATNLVTHAMLKDSEGNPVSITKTDTDVVTIYATVFITFGSQYENLAYIGLPNNNSLINFLVGNGSAPSGSFGLLEGEGYGIRLGSTSTAIWVSDVSNKKRKTNTMRFGINDANGHIKALEFTNLFNIFFPVIGIFTGQAYSDVPVGVGDGIKDEFYLSSRNILLDSLAVKLDGVATYDILKSKHKAINFPFKLYDTPSDTLSSVSISRDGKVIVVKMSSNIIIYDLIDDLWLKRTVSISAPSGVYDANLSQDGSVIVASSGNSPYIHIWDWDGTSWTKNENPSTLPTVACFGSAISDDGNVVAVAGNGGVSVYRRIDKNSPWIKTSDPASPPSNARRVCLSGDGLILIASSNSQTVIASWDWNGTNWVKRVNPSTLPGAVMAISLSQDGTLLVASHVGSPYLTSWDWNGTAWIKRNDPSTLPVGMESAVALTPDGNTVFIGGATSPYIAAYDWIDSAWVRRPDTTAVSSAPSYIAVNYDSSIIATARNSNFDIYDCKPRLTKIKFSSPPLTGKIITADYTVAGIHKTNQYVIDVSFSIQFGEGV